MKGTFEKHQQLTLFEKEQESTQKHDDLFLRFSEIDSHNCALLRSYLDYNHIAERVRFEGWIYEGVPYNRLDNNYMLSYKDRKKEIPYDIGRQLWTTGGYLISKEILKREMVLVSYDLEYPIMQGDSEKKFYLGTIDCIAQYIDSGTCKINGYEVEFNSEYTFIVEFKPEIKSWGGVIRQIKVYHEYVKGIPVIITNNDISKWVSHCETQNIYCLNMDEFYNKYI